MSVYDLPACDSVSAHLSREEQVYTFSPVAKKVRLPQKFNTRCALQGCEKLAEIFCTGKGCETQYCSAHFEVGGTTFHSPSK